MVGATRAHRTMWRLPFSGNPPVIIALATLSQEATKIE